MSLEYAEYTIDQLRTERAKIDAELARRAEWNYSVMYGCCNRIPCERTACPRAMTFVRGTIT